MNNYLQDDLTFRYVFNENAILNDFVNSFLEFIDSNDKFRYSDIKFSKEIFSNKKDKKMFYGDVVVGLTSGDYLNIEMYKHPFTKEKYNKSTSYMCRMYSNELSRKDKNYNKIKKVISLNLINNNFRRMNNDLVNKYEFGSLNLQKVVDEGSLEMYLVRLDLVQTIPYNKNEKRFIRWLRLINANTIQEMKYIGKDDKIMKRMIEFIEEWNNPERCERNFQDYLDEEKKYSRKEGRREGKKEGKIEGRKEGAEYNVPIGVDTL